MVTRKQLIELGLELRFRAELSMEEERGPIYGAISVQSQGLTLYHMIELLESQGPSTLRSFVERMESDGKRSTVSIVGEGGYRVIKQFLETETVEHPKVGELISIVDEQLRKNKESRVLIFTQYRDTASHLVEALNRVDGVRAERFVGQAMKVGDRGLTQDEQSRMIEDFRRGTVNILCATSVGEEGLDIPEVDLVVFYEPVPSEIRYIQRKGRTGRRMPGRVIILASAGTSDEVFLDISRSKAERMKAVVQSLNERLRPVMRLGKMPPPDPMTEAELERLRRAFPGAPTTHEIEDREKLVQFDATVRMAMQALYMRVLESDMKGLGKEELISELESEGFSRRISELALKRLTRSKRVLGGLEKVSVPIQEIQGAKVMTVTVVKIALGGALVVLDGNFEARLEASNYDGPRELIKKGSSFRALCELYESSGELNVNVRQVVGLG